MRTPLQKYNDQKQRAKKRDINFLLTFDEWWDFWQSSGHWDQRGTCKGQYVMSRYGDQGDYCLGNIFVQPVEDNISQGNKGKAKPKSAETKAKMSAVSKGRPSPRKGKKLGFTRISPPRGERPKLTCPHCGKTGGDAAMKHWHFNNCKIITAQTGLPIP